MKIAIIGSGMMGSALAFPARENGNEVSLIGTSLEDELIDTIKKSNVHPKLNIPFPEGMEFYHFKDWKTAVLGCDFVVCGISSYGVDWFYDSVLCELDPSVPVLSITKGLLDLKDGSLISYSEHWKRRLSDIGINRDINAIGGPCTSLDLVSHDHTQVALCGKSYSEMKMMQEVLQTDYYHISLTYDIEGLESAVALKNAFAMAVAMTIGPHCNSQAGAFYQAVREMNLLLDIQGASSDCKCIGIGDLYVTVLGGRTRTIGKLIGECGTWEKASKIMPCETFESLVIVRRVYHTLQRMEKIGKARLSDFPLLCHAAKVLEEGRRADMIPWDSFTFSPLI